VNDDAAVPGDVTNQIRDIVRELVRELSDLGISDQDVRVAAGNLIAEAAKAGARIGAAEIVAQLVERGIAVDLELRISGDLDV